MTKKFKFCPMCGGKLVWKKFDAAMHPVCSICDFHFFQNSKPTSSAYIVNDKNEVLLVKRAHEPSSGKWTVPGGFLENGEDPIVGLIRELKEELNVTVKPLELRHINIGEYGYAKCDYHTLNLFYICKIGPGTIKLDHENTDYRWFSKKEIPWKNLAFANDIPALKALLSKEDTLLKPAASPKR